MDCFPSEARCLDPVFGMVENGGDDVRHRETEAGLKEEDCVEDSMTREAVDCGAVSVGIAGFGRIPTWSENG